MVQRIFVITKPDLSELIRLKSTKSVNQMKIMDRQNVLKDRILSSSDNESWSPSIPLGSYYQAILADVHKYLDEHGDWILLKNCITKEVFWASQFEPLAKK